MITMSQVCKRFGNATAVDGVSLEIEPGSAIALWGTNGAGKTTLIRCVLGLVPFYGRITVGGFDVRRDGKRARRLIGYVPQELGFYDELHVDEAIFYFSRLKGERRVDVGAVLAGVGLVGHEGKRVRDLSGGMKQRLALAIALLGNPPILMLDEVTASLDACGREEFVALLSKLARKGRTLVFASHRLEEVTTLASRVVVLEKGKMVASIAVAEFASYLGHGSTLHLHIAARERARALEVLKSSGFQPHLNGVGVLVPVPQTQRAAPFRVLSEARIAVEDFDVLSNQAFTNHSRGMEGKA